MSTQSLWYKQELLELGDRIGYVSTGLRDDDVARCVRKMNNLVTDNLLSSFVLEMEKKCSVCQVRRFAIINPNLDLHLSAFYLFIFVVFCFVLI